MANAHTIITYYCQHDMCEQQIAYDKKHKMWYHVPMLSFGDYPMDHEPKPTKIVRL